MSTCAVLNILKLSPLKAAIKKSNSTTRTAMLLSLAQVPLALKKFFLISIHALQAECDISASQIKNIFNGFQSTHSKRSATLWKWGTFLGKDYFNPRTPSGVRHHIWLYDCTDIEEFQSTHSKRSATQVSRADFSPLAEISIHAPLTECDLSCKLSFNYFNPILTPRSCMFDSCSRFLMYFFLSIPVPLAECYNFLPPFVFF